MRSIGVIGGSFDPVHYGHICLAEDARDMASLDKVVFMPARFQPFKLDRDITSGKDRAAMLEIAVEGEPDLTVSTLELDAERISYTYLTLRELRTKFGSDDRIYFITGTDTFIELSTWYKGADILAENGIVVGIRPGYKEDEVWRKEAHYRKSFGTDVKIIHNRRLDISSTAIREKIMKGESTGGMLPDKVRDYIDEHGLYK